MPCVRVSARRELNLVSNSAGASIRTPPISKPRASLAGSRREVVIISRNTIINRPLSVWIGWWKKFATPQARTAQVRTRPMMGVTKHLPIPSPRRGLDLAPPAPSRAKFPNLIGWSCTTRAIRISTLRGISISARPIPTARRRLSSTPLAVPSTPPAAQERRWSGHSKTTRFWDVVAGSYCDASEKLKLDCGQSKANGTFQKNDVNNICHGFSCDLPRANNGQPAPVDVAVTTLCASGNCVLESYGEEKPGVYDQRQNMDQVNAALKQLQEKIEKEKYKYKNVGLWFGWKNPQTIRKVERKTKFFDYNSRSIMNLNHNSQDPKHPYNFIDYQWDQENEIWAWQFTGMGFHPKAGTCPALK